MANTDVFPETGLRHSVQVILPLLKSISNPALEGGGGVGVLRFRSKSTQRIIGVGLQGRKRGARKRKHTHLIVFQ